MTQHDAGPKLDALIAEQVVGESLDIPRERAMAIVGAMYVRETGPVFKLDVHDHELSIRVPRGEDIPSHPSDDNFNQRYFRYVVQELLNYPNEIGELVARDVAQCRKRPATAYSTDIAEAWRVHQVMCLELFSGRRRYFAALQAEASEAPPNGQLVAWPDVLCVLRDRMPLAICRAALAASPPSSPPSGAPEE